MEYYLGEIYWRNVYMTSTIKQVCMYIFENTKSAITLKNNL